MENRDRWYCVSGHVVVSAYRYVKAESPEAAVKKAKACDCTVALAPYGPAKSGINPILTAVVEDADGMFIATAAEVQTPAAEYLEDLEDLEDTGGPDDSLSWQGQKP